MIDWNPGENMERQTKEQINYAMIAIYIIAIFFLLWIVAGVYLNVIAG